MFHQGSLQSGIALAIQEQKLVACFVRDDGDESSTWENDWLQGGWLSSLLAQKAVLLRIDAGSTEAGFLSAFCPVETTPTFVVIQNGQLQDQLVGGVTKDDFTNRIRKVLGASAIPTAAQPPAPAPAPIEDARPAPPTAPTSTAKGKQKAIPATSGPKPPTSATQQAARDKVRKDKQQEKDELARIKARIEADKAERKAQIEARKADRERLARGLPSAAVPPASPSPSPSPATTSTRGSRAKDVHLNVRLFDGRTIRSTFPRTAKLQDDVRPWIDQEFATKAENPRDRHPPYIFKQIMAPLPSRELSVGEENETLGDIDLAPSATLVLIPVKGYNEAYSGGGRGIVSGVPGSVTNIVGGAIGLAYSAASYVGSTLGSIAGYGGDAAQDTAQSTQGRTLNDPPQPDGTSNIRVRTIADQQAREPRSQQLYNGNQLNFEPRDEDLSSTSNQR